MPNKPPLTFAVRFQTHEVKIKCIQLSRNKTSPLRKSAQITIIESTAFNSLLTGVKRSIGQILRQLQQNHLETQTFFNKRNDTALENL